MTKQDWLDYFEAINGRSATEAEIAQAAVTGEFKEEVVKEIPQTRRPQPATGVFPNNTAELQAKGKAYFAWFIGNLKNPDYTSEKSYFNYGIITLAVSAIFMASGIVNFFHRMLMTLANANVDGTSLLADAPDKYNALRNIVSSNFSFGLIVQIAIALFVLYVVVVSLPTILHKLVNKSDYSIKNESGKYMLFTPVLAIINLLALVSSFLISDHLVLSSSYIGSMFSLDSISNPMSAMTSLLDTIKDVPALVSIQRVIMYLFILSVLSMLVLIVALIKNTNVSFWILNKFYVSCLSLITVLLVCFFVDKYIARAIIAAFAQLAHLF